MPSRGKSGTESGSPCKLERGEQVSERQESCLIAEHSFQAELQRFLLTLFWMYPEGGGSEDPGWKRPGWGGTSEISLGLGAGLRSNLELIRD